MHRSSYDKMASFFEAYRTRFPREGDKARVLEIGSKSYEAHTTYRTLIDNSGETYTGLDLEDGLNVDIVPASAYVWGEIPDDSFDVCISGQTFEHNPFFWVTVCEIGRVLVPGGFACIIAPGGGAVHRYPVDCYRFYPDSWAAMAALAGLEIEEVFFETDETALQVKGGRWRDSMMIARKPETAPAGAADRRNQVAEPFRNGFGAFTPVDRRYGPAVEAYKTTIGSKSTRTLRSRMASWLSPFGVMDVYRG